jgi:Ca-activated chloride channel family protein
MMEGPARIAAPPLSHGKSFMKLGVPSRIVVPVVLLNVALTHAIWAQQTAQQPPIRSGAKTVAVYATVTDKEGRLVPDLERDAFEVRDNGKPQPLTVFSNEIQPLSIVMMLDRSGSMMGNAGLVQRAAAEFVKRLRPEDKARIGAFGERIEIEPAEFTSDQQQLLRALQSEIPVKGPTPLWNATNQALDTLRGQEGRKVVLIFSDGGDSPVNNFSKSNSSIMDIMRGAQQDDVMVYSIGLAQTAIRRGSGNPAAGGFGALTGAMTVVRPDPGLATIADETGGGYFELTRADDLGSTFARVAEELRHQYALGFEPPRLDDKMHDLDVKVSGKGMKVRARKEYFAKK